MRTKAVTLRNKHLDPGVHKKPKLSRVVGVDSLADVESNRVKGARSPAPVHITENVDQPNGEDLRCLECLPPLQRHRTVSLLNGLQEACLLVRLSVNSLEQAHSLCEAAVQQTIAVSANCIENGRKYVAFEGSVQETECALVVDLEVEKTKMGLVKKFLAHELRYEPELSCFAIVDEDIYVT